jgi:hypothetical protein
MWTIGAFRPRAQLFSLLSTWFYSHPKMDGFRPFINKTLETPSLYSSGTSMIVNTCNVRLSGDTIPTPMNTLNCEFDELNFGSAEVNLCHPLWVKRNVSLINSRNGTAVRCYGDFDAASAANEVILGLTVMLYSGLQSVCAGECSNMLSEAMAAMSSTAYSAWSAGDQDQNKEQT